MKYRRVFVPQGTYFFTLVTFNRLPYLKTDAAIKALWDAVEYTRTNHPFDVDAFVILPDHLHMVWTLPPDDNDYPTRWRLIKSHFTHHFHPQENGVIPLSRVKKQEQAVWQRRYWEHLIRNEQDLQAHIEYIHYNPVKHGLANTPAGWPYSSIHE
jgi:putative transposase